MSDDYPFSYQHAQRMRWFAITMNLLIAVWHVSDLDWSALVALPHLMIVWYLYGPLGKSLQESARLNAIRKLTRGHIRHGD